MEKPSVRDRRRVPSLLVLLGGVLVAAGCAQISYDARPIVPAQAAASFDSRSLASAELRAFLAENRGLDPAAAWPPPAWDFETLSWVAFFYHPSLDVARAQWRIAQGALQTAGARPNPTLSVTPGFATNPGEASPWFPAIAADFLLEPGRRRTRIEAGKLGAEAARQGVFVATWNVRSDLRQALDDLRLAEQRATFLRAQAGEQQKILGLLQHRLDAGAIASGDVATARLNRVKGEAAALDAEREVPLARQRVAQALGLPATALAEARFLPATHAPALTSEALAEARAVSLQTRADVLAALANYEASQAALAIEASRRRPDLHLGPGYQWDQGTNKWSLSLTLELPLFNRNEGPIAEAAARRDEAAAQFLATQAQAIAAIDGAAAAADAAAAQVASSRAVRNELEDQLERAQARFDAGSGDQLELADAQLALSTGELALAEADARLAAASGRLEDALQIPFANLAAIAPATSATNPPSATQDSR